MSPGKIRGCHLCRKPTRQWQKKLRPGTPAEWKEAIQGFAQHKRLHLTASEEENTKRKMFNKTVQLNLLATAS
jgi:hypothetical protein